eukprot:COSAG01_NODE_215_length_21709_cov_141.101217_29_plen_69_part_00
MSAMPVGDSNSFGVAWAERSALMSGAGVAGALQACRGARLVRRQPVRQPRQLSGVRAHNGPSAASHLA